MDLTINHINSICEDEFLRIVKSKMRNYHPKRVRRVEIPKVNGEMRPLGIPTIWDRIIQQCFLQVLEPICEAKFFERSNDTPMISKSFAQTMRTQGKYSLQQKIS